MIMNTKQREIPTYRPYPVTEWPAALPPCSACVSYTNTQLTHGTNGRERLLEKSSSPAGRFDAILQGCELHHALHHVLDQSLACTPPPYRPSQAHMRRADRSRRKRPFPLPCRFELMLCGRPRRAPAACYRGQCGGSVVVWCGVVGSGEMAI